jgi:quercetin dioxygenase-like cupin family protein
MLKCKEKHVPGRTDWDQSRGAFEDWVDPTPPKYWKSIVVSPEEAAPTLRKDGEVATQIGQLGYSLISSKTVNSLTLRVGVAELPMNTREEVGYHWHNCEEVLYILQGKGWADVEGERRRFKAGDALFFPFRTKHRTWMDGDEPVKFVFIVGIRLRPYEGLTESSIDYREYYRSEE